MLTLRQLREMAWLKYRAARTLAESLDFDTACDNVGLAVELILKARIVHDKNLSGFPESNAEFNSMSLKNLKTHDFETLLAETVIANQLKLSHANEWATCLQWSPDTKYSPMGTATKTSALALLSAAEAIIKEINDAPELAVVAPKQSDNVYVRLLTLEQEVAIEKGRFELYAIVHREGAYTGSADLLVSASWIDPESRAGADYVSKRVAAFLGTNDVGFISGVIALPKDHPVVRWLTGAISVQHNMVDMIGTSINGKRFDRIVVMSAGDPAARAENKRLWMEQMRRNQGN